MPDVSFLFPRLSIRFDYSHIFGRPKQADSIFQHLLESNPSQAELLTRMKKILSPFILRRLKSEVLNEKLRIVRLFMQNRFRTRSSQRSIQSRHALFLLYKKQNTTRWYKARKLCGTSELLKIVLRPQIRKVLKKNVLFVLMIACRKEEARQEEED